MARLARLFVAVFLTSLPVGAGAGVMVGNPTTKIALSAGPDVHVDGLTAYRCSGGSTWVDIDDVVSTTGDLELELPEGEWCDLEVELYWTGTSPLDSVLVDGFTTYETQSGEAIRTITLDPGPRSATLN